MNGQHTLLKKEKTADARPLKLPELTVIYIKEKSSNWNSNKLVLATKGKPNKKGTNYSLMKIFLVNSNVEKTEEQYLQD
jgi:hypothetical protein